MDVCQAHYGQRHKGRELTPLKIRPFYDGSEKCLYVGCPRKVESHGMCHGHYCQSRSGKLLRPIGRSGLGTDPCSFPACTGSTKREFCLFHRSFAVELKRKYGLSVMRYFRMMIEQVGLCRSCKASPATDVDHCHKSMVVRGILCGGCNKGLGQFRDDPVRLLAAIYYLEAVRGDLD